MNDKLTVGSLFSGIGGLELGLERTGYFETRWQCEINEYARKVLAKNWPGLPIYNDIKELYESEWPEKVDVLCGGFPCQPFSTAGKRRGETDERFLWPEFVRVVREVQPRWVIAENVPGLLTIDSGRVFGRILGDLAECGYDAEWDTISAASVGALHPRNRIFIVGRLRDADRTPGQLSLGRVPFGTADAWGDGQGQAVLADANGSMPGIHPGAISEAPGALRRGAPETELPTAGITGEGSQMANSDIQGLEGRRSYRERPGQRVVGESCAVSYPQGRGAGRGDVRWQRLEADAGPLELGRRDNRPGMFRDAIGEWWAIEPDVGRVANGVPARVDRLRCLGNAVVPQCAEYIGTCILEWEGLI